MASSRSEENVNLRHFPTQDGVTVLVSPAILLDSCHIYCCGRCFSHYCMALWCCLADVIALLPYEGSFCFLFGWCYSLVALLIKIDGDVYTIRLMFLPYLLMVLTILWLMLLPHWYSCTRIVPLVFVLFRLMLLPGWLMLLPSWGLGQML